MPDNDDARSSGSEIQAVDRAAQILALFGPETPEITAGMAAEKLRLNRTTTYRYCVSLEAAGLLERGAAPGSYAPGVLLVQLGVFALGRRKVVDQAASYMRDLCTATGLTTVLSLWGPNGPIVSRVEEDATRAVVLTVRVGTPLAPISAQSKVFYAHVRDQARVERILEEVPAGRRAEVLADVRELVGTDAIAMSPDGFGAHAMAAPVFDESGICASLALIATKDMLPLDRESPPAQRLREAARALTVAMGGRLR